MKKIMSLSLKRILSMTYTRTAYVVVLALMVLSSFLPLLLNPVPAQAESPFTKLADPVDLPFGPSAGVAFSPDGLFLAVADGYNPSYTALHGATVYKRSGDTFTKVLDIAGTNGVSVAWSPNGTYLAVSAYGDGHNFMIYKRSGDTFTKLTLAGDYNSGRTTSVAFSPDGKYLATAININNLGVVIYKINYTLDTFTLLDPSQMHLHPGTWVTFSPDSTLMVVTGYMDPEVAVLSVGADIFTPLPNPAQPDGAAYGAAFSPDGACLAVAYAGTDNLTIYNRSGSAFAKATKPAVLPSGTGNGVAFSRDSAALSVAHQGDPYLISYIKWTVNIFNKLDNPAVMPTGIGHGVAFSPASNYMAVAHETTPFVTIYKYPSLPTPPPAPAAQPQVTPLMFILNSHNSSLSTTTTTSTTPTLTVTNAVITTQSASLSAKSVTPGTPVTVTADITNKSAVNGIKKVTLYVNGQVESTQGVTVNSGSSSKVTFNVSRSEPGDYNVYVDGVPAGSFKVELFRESDMILIFSIALIAIAFIVGMVILQRRQRTS